MFDPHRTRRSDRRFYTRKGQVIQANRVNTGTIIDQRLVPIYKDYLIRNSLAYVTPQPAPVGTFVVSGIAINNYPHQWSLFTKYTTPTVNLLFNTGTRNHLIMVFYQDTEGNHFCYIGFQAANTTYSKTIEDNVECYFLATPNLPGGINSQAQIDSYEKGIINESGNNYFFTFFGSNLNIIHDIPLTTS